MPLYANVLRDKFR